MSFPRQRKVDKKTIMLPSQREDTVRGEGRGNNLTPEVGEFSLRPVDVLKRFQKSDSTFQELECTFMSYQKIGGDM